MKQHAVVRIAAVLVLAGMFCMTPVLAGDPVLISSFSGKIGTVDSFMSGKVSALSDAKITAGFEKLDVMSGFSPTLQSGKDLSSLTNAPIDGDYKLDPTYLRITHRIPRCRF